MLSACALKTVRFFEEKMTVLENENQGTETNY